MKPFAVLGLAGLLALGTVGCNTHRITGHSPGFSAPRRATTYALAVTVHGGLQPTPAQWAAIHSKIADELSWLGATLVTDVALADKIIRVDFRPNPINPESSGHLTILGVRTNPYAGVARRTTPSVFSPAFSFAGSFMPGGGWGSSNFYSGDYFNYLGPWSNGYTYGNATVVTLPKTVGPKPPHRHTPNHHREICPPDTLLPRSTPTYAAASSSSTSSRSLSAGSSSFSPAYTSPEAPARARWTGERSAWQSDLPTSTNHIASSSGRIYGRSDGGYSRSERSYSRSDSGGSRDSGWWRSNNDSSHRDYSSYSGSSGSMSAGSSHVTPAYTSPSPSYSSSSSSSGSLSSHSSSSSSSSTTTTSTDAER